MRAGALPAFRLVGASALVLMLALSLAPATTWARNGRRVEVNQKGVVIEDLADTAWHSADSSGTARSFHYDHPGGRLRISGRDGTIDIDDTDALVRMFSDITVESGERIEGDVVAVVGSVTVRGTVGGNVVAVGGSVHLEPGAQVDGDCVAVGGALDQEKGARVGGESISIGFLPVRLGVPTLPILLFSVFACWLITLFMGWLVTMIAPERTVRVGVTLTRRTGLSLLLGLLALPAVAAASMLLLITVVGIPVAFLLPILYVVLLGFGHVAATAVLGARLMRRRLGEGSIMAMIAAGSGFVALFFVAAAVLSGPPGIARTIALFFGTLGLLFGAGLGTLGLGAVIASRLGSDPRDVTLARRPDPAISVGPLPTPTA